MKSLHERPTHALDLCMRLKQKPTLAPQYMHVFPLVTYLSIKLLCGRIISNFTESFTGNYISPFIDLNRSPMFTMSTRVSLLQVH